LNCVSLSAPATTPSGGLSKNILRPHLKRQWVIAPEASAAFVANMEDVLEVYQRPRDPERPVVCLDETSKQMIVETREAIPAKPGRKARHDYEYARNGVANYAHALRDLSYASGDDHRPAGLGARSGCSCVLCLPMPREKLTNPPDWMIRESGEHVGEPSARINIVTAPRSNDAATIRCFSAGDHRRRRCTVVMISTRPDRSSLCLSIGIVTSLRSGSPQTATRPSPGAYGRLRNDLPLLLLSPPSAAHNARHFRPAPNNLRVVTDVDHDVHTICDPRESQSCTPASHSTTWGGVPLTADLVDSDWGGLGGGRHWKYPLWGLRHG
jgi:hypothetical protein